MVDAENLIAHLSGGLDNATDRAAFRKAAEAALASPDCSGEGAAYRTVTKLWRSYFRPPRDTGDNGWWQERKQRPHSKLINEGPAVGRGGEYQSRKFRAMR